MDQPENSSLEDHVAWMAEVFDKRAIDIDTEDPEWVAAGEQFKEEYATHREALWKAIHRQTGGGFRCLMARMFELDRGSVRRARAA